MSQSLVKNLLHLTWSTKNRRGLITQEITSDLEGYMAGIFGNYHSPALKIGAVEDHVHCLVNLSKNHSLKNVIKNVKGSSSEWMKKQGPEFQQFYWQNGYAAFSVSESARHDVIHYIDNQWEYHQRVSFQEELREFLDRHNLEFDEEHIWD